MTLELKTREDKIKFSLDIILKHFEEPYFPRTIQTALHDGKQIKVNSIDEILIHFEKAKWMDCRISIFGEREINELKPNAIFIDLDKKEDLGLVKARIFRLIEGTPLVIFTGRGYALVLPTNIKPMKNLKHGNLDGEFIAKEFLRFSKDYLTNNRADKANYPSLKSCLLRVPYTINSKNNVDVSFLESWDGLRVSINDLPFTAHLDKIIEDNKKTSDTFIINSKSYSWIENVLSGPQIYKSNRILGLIIARYLMNVKKVSKSDATEIIKKWDNRYDNSQISYELNYALKHGKAPVGFNNFLKNNPDFVKEFEKIPNITKVNPETKKLPDIIIRDVNGQTFLDKPTVFSFEEIGYSKTKDLNHFLLSCYDCNPRGAGCFEVHEKSHKLHEKRCMNIRYLTRAEEITERFEAQYVRPLTAKEERQIEEWK
jgi:hypothetical protein